MIDQLIKKSIHRQNFFVGASFSFTQSVIQQWKDLLESLSFRQKFITKKLDQFNWSVNSFSPNPHNYSWTPRWQNTKALAGRRLLKVSTWSPRFGSTLLIVTHNPRDLWPLRKLCKAMMRYDLTSQNIITNTKTMTKTKTKSSYVSNCKFLKLICEFSGYLLQLGLCPGWV